MNAALARAASSAHGLVFVDAYEQERAMPWSEVRERARRLAGALAERGVRPGDRVAMVLPTGTDFMDAFFGTLLAGAVPVPLYPPVRLGRMAEYVRGTARMLEDRRRARAPFRRAHSPAAWRRRRAGTAGTGLPDRRRIA